MKVSPFFLVVGLVVLMAGCGGKEPLVAEGVRAQALADLNEAIAEAISDTSRQQQALAAVQVVVNEQRDLARFVAERRSAMVRLNADYDSTREQFLAELKKYDDRIRAQQDAVTSAVRQFAEATTEEEWETLRKINTRAMKDFAAVLNAI